MSQTYLLPVDSNQITSAIENIFLLAWKQTNSNSSLLLLSNPLRINHYCTTLKSLFHTYFQSFNVTHSGVTKHLSPIWEDRSWESPGFLRKNFVMHFHLFLRHGEFLITDQFLRERLKEAERKAKGITAIDCSENDMFLSIKTGLTSLENLLKSAIEVNTKSDHVVSGLRSVDILCQPDI